MSKEPTEKDFETTLNTLDWYKAYLEDNEPQATREIAILEEVMFGLPHGISELEKA